MGKENEKSYLMTIEKRIKELKEQREDLSLKLNEANGIVNQLTTNIVSINGAIKELELIIDNIPTCDKG
jgi:chromosome segregation ATPase